MSAWLHVITALGGQALLFGLGRLVRDVWVAKIQVRAQVEIARLRTVTDSRAEPTGE